MFFAEEKNQKTFVISLTEGIVLADYGRSGTDLEVFYYFIGTKCPAHRAWACGSNETTLARPNLCLPPLTC
jgi:hypothetical protein